MATAPLSNLTALWNSIGTTFSAIKMNVTDTASNAASLLLDLQVGGVSKFSVNKNAEIVRDGGAGYTFKVTNASMMVTTAATASATLRLLQVGITDVTFANAGGSGFAVLNGTSTFEQRNGTGAQTFRLYRTFTSSTDYQRLAITSASTTLTALSGASVTATNLIPAGAVVVGVTTRVSTAITGATGYQVGTSGDADRWADKTGTAVGTTTDNRDWTAGTIECFPTATSVVVTAKTSNFTDGAMLVTVHYLAGEAD